MRSLRQAQGRQGMQRRLLATGHREVGFTAVVLTGAVNSGIPAYWVPVYREQEIRHLGSCLRRNSDSDSGRGVEQRDGVKMGK